MNVLRAAVVGAAALALMGQAALRTPSDNQSWHVSLVSRGDLLSVERAVNVDSDGWLVVGEDGVIVTRKNVARSLHFADLAARIGTLAKPQTPAPTKRVPIVAVHPTRVELLVSRTGDASLSYAARWTEPRGNGLSRDIAAIASDIELLDAFADGILNFGDIAAVTEIAAAAHRTRE